MDDSRIIELYFERSEQAIEETAEKYGAFLERVAYNILLDRSESEETVNDTYLGAWNAMPPQRPAVLRHFLSRIARNLSFDRLDRRTARKRGGGSITAELGECVPDRSSGIEREWESRELARSLDRFLAALDEQSLAAFVLRYYYSEPIASIAEKMSLKERRVKYLLSRSRKTLKEHLEKEELL